MRIESVVFKRSDGGETERGILICKTFGGMLIPTSNILIDSNCKVVDNAEFVKPSGELATNYNAQGVVDEDKSLESAFVAYKIV